MKSARYYFVPLLAAGMFAVHGLRAETDAQVFDNMTAKLDKGGSHYSFANTTYLYDAINRGYNDLETQLALMPIPMETKSQLVIAMQIIKNTVLASGVNEIKAAAGSSIVIEPAQNGGFPLFRNRYFLYHGQNTPVKGLIWSMVGEKNQPLDDLNSLPSNTILACSWQVNPAVFWDKGREISVQSNLPPMQALMDKAEKSFQEKNQQSLKSLLDSVSGRWFIVVVEENDAAGKPYMQFMISIPTRDASAFKLMSKYLTCNPSVTVTANEISVNPTQALPVWFKPVIRQTTNRLLIVSNPAIVPAVEKAAAAKDGWVKTPEFKYITQKINLEGTGFFYLSRRYAAAYSELLKSFSPEFSLNFSSGARDCFVVCSRDSDGASMTMNGNMDMNELEMARLNVVAVPILAGMLLPAVNSARERARQVSCGANLKQIGAAMTKYAAANKDKLPAGDNVAGFNDLIKANYLTDIKLFACPSDDNLADGETLNDQNCSYIYFGGLSTKDDFDPNCPLVFDIPGLHNGTINVLYMDGHVAALKAPDIDTCVGLVNSLNNSFKYKPELLKKLQETATRIDTRLGLGEE